MDEVKNYPPYLDYPKPYKSLTNADRIRAMSDEDLAWELMIWVIEIQYPDTQSTILDWLQQPAEE